MAVLPGVASAAQVEQARQQWRSYFDEPFVVAGRPVFVRLLRTGLLPEHGPDGAALLSAADVAMHRAKQQAGTTVLAYAPEMIQRAGAARHRAGPGCRHRGRGVLPGVPTQVRGPSRQLAGFEALVRWQRPGVGRVSPADFIPAAELTGQIGALGELVLRIALRDMVAWQRDGAQLLPVAINVSPLQFRDPQLAEVILREAVAHGIEPRWLDVEVTETAAIGHLDQVLPQLAQLRAAQVGVASTTSAPARARSPLLRRLPISTLKLDPQHDRPAARAQGWRRGARGLRAGPVTGAADRGRGRRNRGPGRRVRAPGLHAPAGLLAQPPAECVGRAGLAYRAITSPILIAPPGSQLGLKRSPPFGKHITTVEPSRKRPISAPCARRMPEVS